MKKILSALALALVLAVPTAQAHGNGLVPFFGGVIIGNMLSQPPRTVYVQPAPVYVQPAPVYVQPAIPVPVNPYALPSNCRLENVYNGWGQYIGQQTICQQY